MSRRTCTKCGRAFQSDRLRLTCGPKCHRARMTDVAREWRRANPQKVREAARRWRATHPEKAREMAARYARRRYAQDPEKARERSRRSRQRYYERHGPPMSKRVAYLLALEALSRPAASGAAPPAGGR